MRIVRLGYLLFVMVLACAHLFVTLSPWTAPAFAADVTTAKTHAECTKAGGVWDAKAKSCKPKM